MALYRAKSERRSALRFFEEQMDHHIHEHDRLARELRAALTARALEIVYQPTVDLATGEVVAFEVSPHWVHAELGEIPPQRFIPIAEEAGLIHELAGYLLEQACGTARCWPEHVRLAIGANRIETLFARRRDQLIVRRLRGWWVGDRHLAPNKKMVWNRILGSNGV